MAFALDIGLSYARNAGADLSGDLNKFAHIDADGDVVLAGAGEHVLGTIIEAAVADKPVTVLFGGIAKVICGGTVTAGQRVASDAAGLAVNAGTADDYEVGTALVSGLVNEIISIALLPGKAHS